MMLISCGDDGPCKKLKLAKEVACANPASKICESATTAYCTAGCADCGVPVPTPEPTPTPVPTPEPTPTPAPSPSPTAEPPVTCSLIPDSEAPGWEPAVFRRSEFYSRIQAALGSVGNTCGQTSVDEEAQRNTLRRVASELNKLGVCAAQWADAVVIKAHDGLYEEWHVVYYGNGCTIMNEGAHKNDWLFRPEVPVCNFNGVDRYEMQIHRLHPQVVDSTPLACSPTGDRCRDLGWTDGRRCCAAAQEGDPSRLFCEGQLIGGPKPVYEVSDGLSWVYENDNWKARIFGTGKIRACYPNGLACSGWLVVN